MKQIHKDYNRAFLLEPTKLNRLMGTIHERLVDHQKSPPDDSFEVFLTGARREEMVSVDDVLKLDNSSRRKIGRLLVVSSVSSAGSGRPEHEVQVDFGRPVDGSAHDNSKTTIVSVSVRSDDAGWASRTLAEVEEQVERTWLPYTSHVLTLVGILILLMLVSTLLLEPVRVTRQVGASTMWLQPADLDHVGTLLRDQHTVTDQEMRDIVTTQLRNVVAADRPEAPLTKSEIRRWLFIIVPVAVILICIVVLMTTCYPRVVFLWGDEDARWQDTLQRRKLLWGIIGTVLVGGLLANPLYDGLSNLIASNEVHR